ncbi:hypothetical protein D9619_000004 [Psilocybe cf. subviscida]|uniref:Uncharacterized protein n=1 Tax=Psilocybe cf. subviscida TaxID=2480587 RepID=A0A8H5BEK2_9AGAR|nr:hypothetical protein D9619_000004 [Psilocybe cf. subviscida]
MNRPRFPVEKHDHSRRLSPLPDSILSGTGADESVSGTGVVYNSNSTSILRLLRTCDAEVNISFDLDFDGELPFSAATATTGIGLDADAGVALGTSSGEIILLRPPPPLHPCRLQVILHYPKAQVFHHVDSRRHLPHLLFLSISLVSASKIHNHRNNVTDDDCLYLLYGVCPSFFVYVYVWTCDRWVIAVSPHGEIESFWGEAQYHGVVEDKQNGNADGVLEVYEQVYEQSRPSVTSRRFLTPVRSSPSPSIFLSLSFFLASDSIYRFIIVFYYIRARHPAFSFLCIPFIVMFIAFRGTRADLLRQARFNQKITNEVEAPELLVEIEVTRHSRSLCVFLCFFLTPSGASPLSMFLTFIRGSFFPVEFETAAARNAQDNRATTFAGEITFGLLRVRGMPPRWVLISHGLHIAAFPSV